MSIGEVMVVFCDCSKNRKVIPFNISLYENNGLPQTMREKAVFFVSEGEQGKGLSWGFRNETHQGPEWCFSLYASNPEVFLSNLNFHLKYAREHQLKDLLCIHPEKLKKSYEKVKWLKRRGHEIDLLVFERIL